MSWWRWLIVALTGLGAFILTVGRRHKGFTRQAVEEEIEVQKELARLRKLKVDHGLNRLKADLALNYANELSRLQKQNDAKYKRFREKPSALSSYLVRTAVRARQQRQSQ